MNKIEIVVSGRKNTGKTKFIKVIADEFGENITEEFYQRTKMVLKGTETKINILEYQLYLEYSEGPCSDFGSPFTDENVNIFYFMIDLKDPKSFGNMLSPLNKLKNMKGKKIVFYYINLSSDSENKYNEIKEMIIKICNRYDLPNIHRVIETEISLNDIDTDINTL